MTLQSNIQRERPETRLKRTHYQSLPIKMFKQYSEILSMTSMLPSRINWLRALSMAKDNMRTFS